MHPRLYFTKFISISVVLHALFIVALLYLARHDAPEAPFTIPVSIVNLPQQAVKKLPPVEQPILKNHIDKSEVLRLPKTAPGAKPDGSDRGTQTIPPESVPDSIKDKTLPFLSHKDIEELARKGYKDKLKNDPLSDETEAFKFLPYGRSLIGALNKTGRRPELANVYGMEGQVFAVFEIFKDGSLGSVTITKSSGYKILDDEVLRTINETAPFQPLPPEWNMERLVVPIVATFYSDYKRIR